MITRTQLTWALLSVFFLPVYQLHADYYPLATAPQAGGGRMQDGYANAYRNFEMNKVWHEGQAREPRVSPPPEYEYPGAPMANLHFQGPPYAAPGSSGT